MVKINIQSYPFNTFLLIYDVRAEKRPHEWLRGVLTGMLRNSKQQATQMVVVFYHLTLKNHICLPELFMIDIHVVDSF